jgi:hypothetical protein
MPNDPTIRGDSNRATSTPRSAFTAPQLALPKGGGALRGIGETFAANLATGTGALTVPIPLSLGRSGSGPQLSLSYGSADSNGPFGFGWRLALAEITRRTDKGLPLYERRAAHHGLQNHDLRSLTTGLSKYVPVTGFDLDMRARK